MDPSAGDVIFGAIIERPFYMPGTGAARSNTPLKAMTLRFNDDLGSGKPF
jgi:hypothetical protein